MLMASKELPANAGFPTMGTSVVRDLAAPGERDYSRALGAAPRLAAALTYRAPAPTVASTLDNVPDFVPPTPGFGRR